MYDIIISRKGMEMLKGRVEWWSKEGYGFIRLDNDKSIFAHLKNNDHYQKIIKENTLIEFTIDKENFSNVIIIQKLQEN